MPETTTVTDTSGPAPAPGGKKARREKPRECPWCGGLYKDHKALAYHQGRCEARPDSEEPESEGEKKSEEIVIRLFDEDEESGAGEAASSHSEPYECGECGAGLSRKFRHCPECGASLEWPESS